METLAIGAATLALAFTASPALANSGEFETKDVEFADLNLNSPEGQARLERRIDSAAKSVCNVYEQRLGTRLRSPEHVACLANARANGKKQMAAIVADQRRGG